MQRVKVIRRTRKGSVAILLDYHDGTRRVQRVFGSATSAEALAIVQEEAEKEARRLEVQMLDNKFRPSIAAILTDFLEHAENSTRRAGTLVCYKNAIAKFTRFLATTTAKRAKDLTPELICQFIRSQASKPDTIRLSLAVLGAAFTRAVDKGDMLTNPVQHPDVREVKPHGRQHERVFTDPEFDALLLAVRQSKSRIAADIEDFFLLLGQTGLRKGEALMLRWCDVSLGDEAYLRVQPHDGWTPKTKTSVRRIPLSPRVDAMLRARIRACGTFVPTARVFPQGLTGSTLQDNFTIALRRANLDGPDPETGQRLRIHSLRHYFATRLNRCGVDFRLIRDLLGHTNVAGTDAYVHMSPNDDIFEVIHKAFSSMV